MPAMDKAGFKILFNLAALAMGLALAVGLCFTPASDGEIWTHLVRGEQIVRQGTFPDQDTVRFSLEQPASFPRQTWLFSVVTCALYRWGGQDALGILKSACLLLAFCFCVATAFRRGSRPFSGILFTLLALLASRPFFDNHLLALNLAFFSAALFLLEGPFWNAFFSRWLWLPLLAVPWVNFSGLGLILLPLLMVWIASESGVAGGPRPANPWLALGIYFAVMAGTLWLTPAGLSNARGLFSGLSRPGTASLALLADTQSILVFMAVLLGLLVVSSWLPAGRTPVWRDTSCFVLFTGLALLFPRLLPFFLVWAAPVAASRLDDLLDALPGVVQGLRWVVKSAALALGLWLIPRVFAPPGFGLRPWPYDVPTQTVEFINDQQLSDGLFNEYRWGGWLAWELKGHNQIFIDASPDGAALRADYREAEAGGWKKIFEKHKVEAALLEIGSPLAKSLAYAHDWQPLSFDNSAVLYVRDSESHAKLISTFAPRGLRPGDPQKPFDEQRLPQAEADIEPLLAKYPSMGRLYYYRAALYLAKGNRQAQWKTLARGIESDPLFLPNTRWLADLKAKAGDKEGARRLLEAGLKVKPDLELRRELARLR